MDLNLGYRKENIMKIVDFIKEHENWEDILTREPYKLKIVRDNGFILFKYDTVYSDFSLDIVKEARGVISKEEPSIT